MSVALKYALKRAEGGDVEAMLDCAERYMRGEDDVPPAPASAVDWLRRAAEQGSAEAAYSLANMYQDGHALPHDAQMHMHWLKRAAASGNTAAARDLGHSLLARGPSQGSAEEGVAWLKKAVAHGEFPEVHFELSECHFQGEGVAKDWAAGNEWLLKAAELGFAPAQHALGVNCRYGGYDTPIDLMESVRWFTAAALQGNAEAQFSLGECYLLGQGVQKDVTEGVRWLGKASAQGSMDADHALARYYRKKGDYGKAVTYYRKAAVQGLPDAVYGLAMCYRQGTGVPADPRRAIQLFRQAASLEHPDAHVRVAEAFFRGEGVSQNIEEATQWLQEAVEMGSVDALTTLGDHYRGGLYGKATDSAKATHWYKKAAARGSKVAQQRMMDMRSNSKRFRQATKWRHAAAWRHDIHTPPPPPPSSSSSSSSISGEEHSSHVDSLVGSFVVLWTTVFVLLLALVWWNLKKRKRLRQQPRHTASSLQLPSLDSLRRLAMDKQRWQGLQHRILDCSDDSFSDLLEQRNAVQRQLLTGLQQALAVADVVTLRRAAAAQRQRVADASLHEQLKLPASDDTTTTDNNNNNNNNNNKKQKKKKNKKNKKCRQPPKQSEADERLEILQRLLQLHASEESNSAFCAQLSSASASLPLAMKQRFVDYELAAKSFRRRERLARNAIEEAEEDGTPTQHLNARKQAVVKEKREATRAYNRDVEALVLQAVRFAPELLNAKFAQAKGQEWHGVFLDSFQSGALRKIGVSYESFTNVQVLSEGTSQHPVVKATLDGVSYALKEFPASAVKVMLREVRILSDMNHPHVAEVSGIVASTDPRHKHRVYLQMPFYAGGTLTTLVGDKALPMAHGRRLARQMASGLEHLHRRNVIHCDIKPDNILLENEFHVRIADFDVSVQDNQSRATQLLTEAARTVAAGGGGGGGFTREFAAPEVVASEGKDKAALTTAADVYSLGLTMAFMHYPQTGFIRKGKKAEKSVGEEERALRSLLHLMLSDDPRTRPTAAQVLLHDHFVLEERRLIEGEASRRGEKKECLVCFEEFYSKSQGLSCGAEGERHFVCDSCFADHVTSQSTDVGGRGKRQGRVYCVCATMKGSGCAGIAFSDADISRHVPSAVFDVYMTCRRELIEAEYAQRKDAQVAEELRKMQTLSEFERRLRLHRRHITDNILTLRCPNPNGCGQVFYDFTDCFAVECWKCSTQFCGWCLEWCGEDAHPHVRTCRLRESDDLYFGEMARFHEIHGARRRRELTSYLAGLDADLRLALQPMLDTIQ